MVTEVDHHAIKVRIKDILKAETGDEYWEDIPDELFELLKTSVKAKNYDYTMARGHLWLNIEIQIDNESNS